MPYDNSPKKMYDSPKKMDHGMKMMDTAKSTMAKMQGATPYSMYKMKHGSPAEMMTTNYGSAMPNKHGDGDGEKKSPDVKVTLPEVEVTDKKSVPKKESNNAKRAKVRQEYYALKKLGTDKALRKAQMMEIENKHGFFTAIQAKKKG